ncbi:penicillin acylase family protein [Nocardioides sp.]|uniref:penicillin acylase family protein n=1 Tax=Nocardioides sp. TaxID=35761 RepID=UPI002B2786F4|nr:penicillin acylase family protein [Nocardioides sp.]
MTRVTRLYRDEHGIPHVRAGSMMDLARAQGRVTAHDRTWQLEWQRRRATGTTAELVGERGLGWDRLARQTMLVDTARKACAGLSQEGHAFVSAYVEGVNAGLRDDAPELVALGAAPEPWEDWMPLAVFHGQHLLFAGLGGELWRRRLDEALGEQAHLLSYEGIPANGSNAWAVGGARTASGRPLIGGDPHRVIEQPGVYQQVRLACEDPDDPCDVVGFTFPGVPGVQHFAHAGDVAWAITNAAADYQDVHDEEVPPRDVVLERTETVRVRTEQESYDEVPVRVVRTERGVVFETGHSLRDAATELGDVGFDALLPLLRARTVDDVDAALEHWVEPVNNVVIADVHGTVRYRIAGRVPTRDEGVWSGWLEPPRHDVGADGQVVTANERRGPESDAIGSAFAPSYRARRIAELLERRSELTTGHFVEMLDDTLLGTVPALTSLVPCAFDDFDGRMEAGSVQAGRFAAWRSALVKRLVARPELDALFDPGSEHVHDPVFTPFLDPTHRVALALPNLVAAGTPFGIDLTALAREALEEVDAAAPVAWGETHVFAPAHAVPRVDASDLPRPAVSGDSDCVRCTSSYPGQTDVCSRGSVARYVWDLADRSAGGWVVPTGASGVPGDPHHADQIGAWTTGELVPIVTDWDRLTLVDEGSPSA